MQLAIPFKLFNDKYDAVADEFNILFRESRNSQEKLIEFVETYPEKRINVEMDRIDVSFLGILNRAHDRVYVRLTDISDTQYVDALKEKGVRFFFDSSAIAATSVYHLSYLISLGVSDVYLADDLLYDLQNARDIADSNEIGLRLVLNVVPTTLPITDYDKAPWFPPDSIDIIEPFIDTVEFNCGEPYDWGAFGVYYRAWFERKMWHGDISEIIKDLRIFVPDDSLFTQELINYKIQCRKKCTNKYNKCDRCPKFVAIAQEMAEKQIGINKG